MKIQSWNRWPVVEHKNIIYLDSIHSILPDNSSPMLPFGFGKSYGDVCLNENGTIILTKRLDHFIEFDREKGILRCESGLLLSNILELIVPQGWFLPVIPGTSHVTVGGCIANDVHGKNHHSAGTFGHHVIKFELLRSDGSRITCSPETNSELYYATIGGLGLTGCITWVEIQLVPVSTEYLEYRSIRFNNLEEFWATNEKEEKEWPYTVAWIDCLSSREGKTRGIYLCGRHAQKKTKTHSDKQRQIRFPFTPPFSLVNPLSLRAFNFLYYHKKLSEKPQLIHYRKHLFPLDNILDWNKIYGRKGFFQYQCVLPPGSAKVGIAEMLERIGKSGQGSFLAVLKTFGVKPSIGMLSFPRPGVTLALDFPNYGQKTLNLFKQLDEIVKESNGALYPAKDARMPADLFHAGFPEWERFCSLVDPDFSSGFFRRMQK